MAAGEAAALWAERMKASDNPEVFMQAANFYSSENDLEKAISAMKKASELAPENIGYLQNLGSFYMRAERFDEAEAVCNKVLSTVQDQWARQWANSELINIYQRQDRLQDLAEKFESDMEESPEDVSQYKKLAELYQTNDRRKEASGVYEKAVAAGVADRDVLNRLLDLYEWTEDFDKAVAQVDKIISMSPDEVYLYERKAGLLARQGRYDDAKKVWQAFLQKVPNDAGAFSRFGDRLNEWGDVDGAIQQYRKAQSLDTNNLWYSMRVADILIAGQDFDEAKKELDGIISGTSDDWMKQDAQRKLADIDARQQEVAAEPEVAPEPAGVADFT